MTTAEHLHLATDNYGEEVHEPVKVPPHNLDSEAAVLSAVMIAGEQLGVLVDFLLPEHFYSESHRWIYQAAIEIYKNKDPVDVVTIGHWLKNNERLGTVGGMSYLTEILNCAQAISHVRAYAVGVFDLWRARRAIAAMQIAEARGYIDIGDVQEFLSHTARQLSDIALRNVGRREETNAETLRREVQAILDSKKTDGSAPKITGLATGMHTLDAVTGGLHGGHKTTITAPPGVGKTAFVTQIGGNVAQNGVGVLMFVTEQKRKEILMRMLASKARVSGRRLKVGKLDEQEWSRVFVAMEALEKLPIFIVSDHRLDIAMIRATTMAYVDRALLDGIPIGLVIADYAQRFQPLPGYDPKDKVRYIGATTKGLKELAQELNIPVIECAQQKRLRKDDKTGMTPKPSTGDTADCSEIEKEADNVYFLYRNPARGVNGQIVGASRERLTLIIDKQRDGEGGCELQLKFYGEEYRFECLDDDATPPEERTPRQPQAPRSPAPAGAAAPPPGFFDRFNGDDDQ